MEDERGHRILHDLDNAFLHDTSLDEYDFLPVLEPQQNKSPVMVVDHKLGIEAWAVKLLYRTAYLQIFSQNNSRKTARGQMSHLTRAALLVNPECATIWNLRKELVVSGDLCAKEELRFISLILTKHPKSAESFAHRKWVLNEIFKSESTSSNDVNGCYGKQIKEEVDVCVAAASRYANNYHAWSHRIWMIQKFMTATPSLLLEELKNTEHFVNRHVSDYSGYHYRQFLLSNLKTCPDVDYTVLLQRELVFASDLISDYPGHEASWCHRLYVVRALVECCANDHHPTSVTQPHQFHKKLRTGLDRQELLHKGLDRQELLHLGLDRQELLHTGLDRQELLHLGLDRQELLHTGLDRQELLCTGLDRQELLHAGLDRQELLTQQLDFCNKALESDGRQKQLAHRHVQWLHRIC